MFVFTILPYTFFRNVIFEEEPVMICYAPLWDTMKQKGVSQYKLLTSGIDNKTLDSLKKNKNITLVTLEKICRIINCSPNDVVRFDP